ncbi:hemolysin family protein [Pelagibacterium sp. 26DY04]|uniref:hemolysin family protein n=1 Tax=Pelagibacterium sp. 26DY04 TaxID=2967130 RepID=UPI0028167E10|nr:hemolysin family protein [Pelagibacterium sp. 26DY04]WMT87083.1 hemolysin family protein [Pelagibacterium sp. 26DY04]
MTDSDQSSAAARRPHRPQGDNSQSSEKKPSFWEKILAFMPIRSVSLRSDLQEALEAPYQDEEGFSASERTILQNVLKLGDMRVEDVMVPRSDIEAVEIDVNVGYVIERFRQVGHSRMPVYEDSLDKVVGMIHIKDVVEKVTEPAKPATGSGTNGSGSSSPVRFVSPALKHRIGKVEDLVRKVLFVPPSMPVIDLLTSMQATHIHMAVVIDEYGGTDGLATIEDLLEAVVGDIEDEHDEEEGQMIRALNEDVFIVDARAELDDLIAAIEDFDPGHYGDEVDTVGGLIFALAGRVPARGEIVSKLKGFDFEITRSDVRRVKQVRISRKRRKQPLMITGPETVALPTTETSNNHQAAE